MAFHQFCILPLELQLRILEFSLPQPRLIDIFATSIHESIQEKQVSCQSGPDTSSWIRTYYERLNTTFQDLPALLHVNRTSRRLVLQHYFQINADFMFDGNRQCQSLAPVPSSSPTVEIVHSRVTLMGSRPFALLDPKRDLVFLQDPSTDLLERRSIGDALHLGLDLDLSGDYHWVPRTSSMQIMVRWLNPDITRSIRRLAIPYYTWRKAKATESLEPIMEFTGIRELFVSFLAGYSSASERRRHWSQAVAEDDERESYINNIQAEVIADLENLSREFPNWKKPVLTVVSPRKELLKLIGDS